MRMYLKRTRMTWCWLDCYMELLKLKQWFAAESKYIKTTEVQKYSRILGFGFLGRDTCTFHDCTFAVKAQKYKSTKSTKKNPGRMGPYTHMEWSVVGLGLGCQVCGCLLQVATSWLRGPKPPNTRPQTATYAPSVFCTRCTILVLWVQLHLILRLSWTWKKNKETDVSMFLISRMYQFFECIQITNQTRSGVWRS